MTATSDHVSWAPAGKKGTSQTIRQTFVKILATTLSGLFALGLAAATAAPALSQAAGTWTTTGSMTGIKQHRNYTATLLQNGQVLVAGGINLGMGIAYADAFLYNHSTGEWTETGSMTTTRYDHTATLLPNGQVLVTGGFKNDNSGTMDSAELYNPSTGRWSTTGSMTVARYNHSAVLLQNGEVLIAGGQTSPVEPIGGTFTFTSGSPTSAAEIYNPSTGKFTATGSMHDVRASAQLTLLPSGAALIAGGGTGDAGCTAELFSNGDWSLTSELDACGVTQDDAALLSDGDVLIEAGSLALTNGSPAYSLSEFYDPSTNVWQAAVDQPNVWGPLALLTNSQILAVGVVPASGDPASALYDPSTNEWTPMANPPAPFSSGLPGTLTRLLNGQVLATANNYAVLFTP